MFHTFLISEIHDQDEKSALARGLQVIVCGITVPILCTCPKQNNFNNLRYDKKKRKFFRKERTADCEITLE